ncbi:MAG: YheU family protein [Proteobacteria bacterium]|nr:YheU family protein [Pseudomonadota bacterium]MBU1581860.1 YheU family protein [Pseudomonadota bacterium]MBU2454932.1 YheU family protein [Pseudomonadota bacterium]MBU2631576.1 YheU family protein [Pseudomonadota bacterium]
MTGVKIAYNELSPEALQGVVEEFVTRDGTDYGEVEVSLETKILQVKALLKSKKAVIVFDQQSETCTILKCDDPVLKYLDT